MEKQSSPAAGQVWSFPYARAAAAGRAGSIDAQVQEAGYVSSSAGSQQHLRLRYASPHSSALSSAGSDEAGCQRVATLLAVVARYVAILPPVLGLWTLLAPTPAAADASTTCQRRASATLAVWLVTTAMGEHSRNEVHSAADI